jgi:hypothetical protein
VIEMKDWLDRLTALVCAVLCALTGSVPFTVFADGPSAETRTRSGIEWRRYDARGALIERQLDTNGDGRPDVTEYYRDGALLRRDSDRDFNGVTDLVEDFDAATAQRVRSIVDEDYDGTADVLVLFRDGNAVVVERAPASRARAVGRHGAGLVSLRNPFSARRAVDSPVAPIHRDAWIGGPAPGGLSVPTAGISAPAASRARPPRVFRADSSTVCSLHSPRGPPLA